MKRLDHARGDLRERFYRGVAEALTLLHAAPGGDRKQALQDVARILAVTMKLPLVWVGRREADRFELQLVAAAGPSVAYAASLKLSADEREPGGRGPAAMVMREGRARVTSIEASEFAQWREAARQQGFGSSIVAAALTRDRGQLVLAAYASPNGPNWGEGLLDWAQRLADELARFWDHQELLERELRLRRYRDAQRTIQRALLEQPDPQAVYNTLAQALVDIAGAAAVDVYADDGEGNLLRRVALAGPMAEAMKLLPVPLRYDDSATAFIPTQAFMQGVPVVRTRPGQQADMNEGWRLEPLASMGALGCWPMYAARVNEAVNSARPVGVFAVVTHETDLFDAQMRELLGEIADAAGLALTQHAQRYALLQEQHRQTYLALHDVLTGLPNRRALDAHLEGVLARAERHGHLAAVGLLDLDDLKLINDRHGHAEGDHLLQDVATRLRASLRDEDYVARLGGDEFVLVFERLEHEGDLDGLLDRVWRELQRPMLIDEITVQVSASLGISVFLPNARASGEQLLRRADQAMYQAKAHKRQRTRWWSVLLPDDGASNLVEPGERAVPAYGVPAAELLRPCLDLLQPRLPALMRQYHSELRMHTGASRLLAALPDRDVEAVQQRLARHLLSLLWPELDANSHRAKAMHAGFFYAACGVEEVWLMEAIERLRDLLVDALGFCSSRDRRPLGIVLQRLGMEQQWQLESMRGLQRRRVALLARLNALAWSADGYAELIQGVADILVTHDEILSCAAGRPDASGELTYEAVAGEAFASYLRELGRGDAALIGVNAATPEGHGPSGRAWRSATIQHCAHYESDPAMDSWREVAARLGIVSSVAVPLCRQPRTPSAVLTIYSSYVGGFQSEDQLAFVEQIKAVLDLALARLSPPRLGAALLPFFVRERWRALIATDALQMHFQPVVRLADGCVVEFEALARLRDDDGRLLAPDRFLPVLNDEDLLRLFRQGLAQVAACRKSLAQAGFALDMSVNVPAAALEDPRYVETTAAVLAEGSLPAAGLLLEILESAAGAELSAPLTLTGTEAFRALGVRLVEDDLGAGYSSLIRLREWPFARIKIDQEIVLRAIDDPLRTLRFIRQLIRLVHDLGLDVVVEGLQTAGLIEAALILGADLGQGYALARPMPPQELAGWLRQFQAGWSATRPSTVMGALAGTLLWEEQLVALPPDALFWQRHAQADCACGGYLRRTCGGADTLIESHAAMHAAAVAGPHDAGYQHWRQAFVSALIAHDAAGIGIAR
jgi:diguanylate cyclase (GGDEF)-like protein